MDSLSISALRAYSGTALPSVYITDSLRRGIFRYVAGDISPDDGAIVLVDASGSRYLRNFELLTPEMFGAVGDGVTDDTAAFQACVTAADVKYTILLTNKYRITDTITTSFSTSWRGVRSEKGQFVDRYNGATIIFEPVDTTKYLVFWVNTVHKEVLDGPFVFENITFKIDAAGGIRIGDETLGTTIDAEVQAYYAGVQIVNCRFNANPADRTSDADGRITRSGMRMIWLTKCFESRLENLMLTGGDVQIRLFGCDNLRLTNVRSQGSHSTLHSIGSGTFQVPNIIDEVQTEGYTFCSMLLHSGAEVSNSRVEPNGAIAENLRYNLSALASPITATVTADSTTITFSRSVEGIIFPYESILEIEINDRPVYVYPVSVSGASITFEPWNTVFKESGSGLTVHRVHSNPIICTNNTSNKVISGTSLNAPDNCFHIVYACTAGNVSAVGCHSTLGFANVKSLAIPNIVGKDAYVNSRFSFVGCDRNVIADPDHPLVYVDNIQSRFGLPVWGVEHRTPDGNYWKPIVESKKIWAYSPKSVGTSINWVSHNVPIERVKDTNHAYSQAFYCWLIYPSGAEMHILDRSLSCETWMKITIKARCATQESSNLRLYFERVPGGGTAQTLHPITRKFSDIVIYTNLNRFYWRNPDALYSGFALRTELPEDLAYVASVLVESAVNDAGFQEIVLDTTPTSGWWNPGDRVNYSNPVAGGHMGLVCVSAGTAGTLASCTGSINVGSSKLTVSDADYIVAGDYLSIVGVTGVKKVLWVDGTDVTLDSAASATVSGAAVAYSAPVFKTFGAISV